MENGYPMATPYPNNQGYAPPAQNPGYPPTAQGFPPAAQGYPPNQGNYPAGYPPSQPSYPGSPVAPQSYPFVGSDARPGYPAPIPSPVNYPQSQGPYPNPQPSPSGFPPQGAYQGGIGVAPTQPDSYNPPSAADMASLPGYEGVSFDSTPSAPPPFNSDAIETNIEEPQKSNFPQLTEDNIREALSEFVSKNCCYGSSPAKTMAIEDIQSQSSFHYKLESFTEKRETSWQFEPYKGQQTISAGPAPGPWEVQVNRPASFTTSKQTLEVPNTANVRPCHDCVGLGRKRCRKCQGNCAINCHYCNGKGKRFSDETCDRCSGTGRERCTTCQANGHESCNVCKEQGNLRYFIRLEVSWKNTYDDTISESTVVPIKFIRSVTGEEVFKDCRPRVAPISNFYDTAVVEASQKLVNEHATKFTQERILEQRHSVQIIPISEISFKYKKDEGMFYIYGFENQVYFPKYPHKCLCGCCGCGCVIL